MSSFITNKFNYVITLQPHTFVMKMCTFLKLKNSLKKTKYKATTKKILKTCHINHHTQTHYTFFVILCTRCIYTLHIEVLQINGAISLNTRFKDPRKIHKMKNLFRTYYGPYTILRVEYVSNICYTLDPIP